MSEYVDVLIVGAGLSGIGAGHHLQTMCPDRSYAILEARGATGGTWDLFRYPGVRSDSDMHTLGYGFRPWTSAKAIADGPAILDYLRAAARDQGVDRHIRLNHRVVAASWSTDDAQWSVAIERGDTAGRIEMRCAFLFLCSGYYDYAKGHDPAFVGAGDFAGRIVHPQFWPDDLDFRGKRVVVIGSGATAVTLVPEMAKSAAHVVMLQRSPTYILARPAEDRVANALRRVLPAKAAYAATRWKNVLLGQFFYAQTRKRPAAARKRLLGWVRDHLGPEYDVERHFTPSYDPWDQRVCLVPDADLFKAIRASDAEVVTDRVDRFTREGILLESGRHLDADVIVTATGLELKLMGGIALSVDGEAIDPAQSLAYKGMMFSDLPNLALSFGYTNASWTLKSDLTAQYVCRLLNAMRDRRLRQVTPRLTDPSVQRIDFLDFTSGYVRRAADRLPKQGSKAPWRLHQNYLRDLKLLRHGALDDGAMTFSNPVPNRD